MKTRAGFSYPVADDIVEPPSLKITANRDRFQSTSATIESYDNAHSPFFLHSSDHPGLNIVSHVLDGSNYNNWSIAMRMSLDAKNKLSFVDGTLPRPDVSDRMFKIWSRCNSMVKAWLLNVVSKEIYDSILYYEDAVEMWNDLFSRFRVSNLPRKYQLEQSIHTLKQGNLDLSTYYTKKKTLWEQLANTRVLTVRKCNCEHVKELMEEAETSRIIQFLMGLNDNFAHIRGQILNMKPRPNLTEIYNMLDQDESQRLVGSSSLSNPAAAFQVQASPVIESQVNLTQGSFKKPKCSFCNKLGHLVDKCYKKHGYPPGSKWNKGQTIGSTNLASTQLVPVNETPSEKTDSYEEFSTDQIQTMISYLSTKLHTASASPMPTTSSASTFASPSVPVISQISGTFLSLFSNAYYDMLISSISQEPAVSSRAWVIDSGATHHVTHNRDLYLELRSLDNTFVRLPNDCTVKIAGIGFIQLFDAISLHNVLYIPEFKFNLISVSVLTKSLKTKVSFTSDECFVQELTKELMIGRGSQVGNLYVLDFNENNHTVSLKGTASMCPDFSLCSSVVVDSNTWHKRLGHPAYSKIDLLSDVLNLKDKKINKEHSSVCHVCHLSKQKHLPFQSRQNMCNAAFDLVHIDTWGPFSVPTKDGFRYFLTIVDDFSRATWIYLLKNKSDVLHVFPAFITMVHTQYQTKLKSVRSDNAHELKFTDLFADHGIVAYHSCPETPEQNSVVERKHQHILNVARALLISV